MLIQTAIISIFIISSGFAEMFESRLSSNSNLVSDCYIGSTSNTIIDIYHLNQNQYIVATCSSDNKYLILLRIDNYNIIDVDSINIDTSYPYTRSLKFCRQPTGKPTIYWVRQDGDYMNTAVYSYNLNKSNTIPDLLIEIKNAWLLCPRLLLNCNEDAVYLLYTKFSDRHLFIRMDNAFVTFSKDYFRKISSFIVGDEKQIQENAKYYVGNSNYLIDFDTVYALYSASYEHNTIPTRIYLNKYMNGNKLWGRVGEAVTHLADGIAKVTPLGIIKGSTDIFYYWSERYADLETIKFAHLDDNCGVTLPRAIDSGQMVFDAKANKRIIAFLLEKEVIVFNFSDSLIKKYDIGERYITYGRIMSIEDEGKTIWIIVKAEDSDRSKSALKIKKIENY